MRTKGRRSSRCSRTASSSTTGCSTASPRKPRRPTRSCTWSTARHCSSDPIRSGACASSPGHSRSRSSRSVMAACRRTTSWRTTRPTARWRSCWSGSSPRSSLWRSACFTALPRRRTRRTCTHRRGLPASEATPPTSGHCSPATGRGRSSNPHRRAGDRGGVRRLMRLLPLLLIPAVLEGDGRWSAAAPLPEPIQELSAAVLHDKIYVAGGIDRTGQATAAAFRYDPAANHWERIADLPAPRHHMPLAVVGDTLYAVGGLAEPSFVPESTLWLYREDRNRWEPRAPLPAPRGASGVGVVSGKLVVVGGWGAGRRLTAASAIYDPATDRPGPQLRYRGSLRSGVRPLDPAVSDAEPARRPGRGCARRCDPRDRRRNSRLRIREPRGVRPRDRSLDQRRRAPGGAPRARGSRGRGKALRDRGWT